MTVDEANHANTVGSSWRRVVTLLEQDDRVSPRQRGFVILAQAQGLIGSTLLVAVPERTHSGSSADPGQGRARRRAPQRLL